MDRLRYHITIKKWLEEYSYGLDLHYIKVSKHENNFDTHNINDKIETEDKLYEVVVKYIELITAN